MPAPHSMLPPPRRIHVLFKTHLDVGFTDFAHKVVAAYVDDFIPRAVKMARELREKHGAPRFVWTTGSWMIHHALEVSSPKRRRELEAAIVAGDIAWHGLPFTTHTELMDAPLFRAGLGIARELDERFGRKTTGSKMTDVPGHTRAMVPLLAEAGIDFLHLGVNPASKAPSVPLAFRWKHDDGSAVNVVYCKFGYGDLTRVAGCEDALYFAHTGDNHGPCSPESVEETYARLRARFPESELRASTLNDVAASIRTASDKLPVVTSEIGDTWIHGVGTDPAKVAVFRAWSRWNAELQDRALAPKAAAAAKRFARRLLMIPEHTWGRDVKASLGWEKKYDRRFRREEFEKARREEPYRILEASWVEQREYLDAAFAELKGTPLQREAAEIREAQTPRPIAGAVAGRDGWQALRAGERLRTPFFDARWSGKDGSLDELVQRGSGVFRADSRHRVGSLWYEVFSGADYAQKWRCYNQRHDRTRDWSVPDFLKPGVETAVKRHQTWEAELESLLAKTDETGTRVLARLRFPEEAHELHGCPKRAELLYAFDAEEPRLRLTVQWFEKPATRVPEATWISIAPRVAGEGWRLNKIGSWIDPRDVVRDGNRALHAVQACRQQGPGGEVLVENLTAPLVAVGGPSLVRYSNRRPGPHDALHFNLHNNTWGTNFPLWYEEDARFEFVLSFGG